jgi:hypothetical protein
MNQARITPLFSMFLYSLLLQLQTRSWSQNSDYLKVTDLNQLEGEYKYI